jgi:hypothetical protein
MTMAAMAAGDTADDAPVPFPASPQKTSSSVPIRSLLWSAAGVEAFLLALAVVAPLGGISQTISPLARNWPVLLAPARALFGDRLVDGSVPPERGWPALALFALLLLGATCVAVTAPLHARRVAVADRRHLALALGSAAVFGLTMVLLPSLPSDDVFSYILYGRIAAVHHGNPLLSAPSAFTDDPFLRLVFWRGVRSVYGPAWLLLSTALTWAAEALGGSLTAYALLFKALGFAAHLTNAALIWMILGRLAPQRRLAGTLLYAWSPLCLLEFCASGHNDAVMLTFALLGIYCVLRRWEVAGLVAFGLSISIKYVLLALLPLYLVLVARELLARRVSPQRVAVAVGWRVSVVAGVVVLTALPFWAGPVTFGSIVYSPPAQQLDNSLIEAVSWPLRSLVEGLGFSHAAAASSVQTLLKLAALAVFAVLWLRQLPRIRSLQGMLAAWGWTLFWYATIASGWFWPWYATWAIAVVALLPWDELTTATMLLSAGVLTLYAFLPLYAAPVYGLRAWIAFGPALGFLLLRRWQGGVKTVWRTTALPRLGRVYRHV